VKPDPTMRRDKRCAQCGGPRTNAVWNRYGHDAAIQDVFCSTACCRAFHQVALPPTGYRDPDQAAA
jgi:hypothetical protein